MQKQFEEVQAAHDRIKSLREATTPPEDESAPDVSPQPAPTATPAGEPKNDVPRGI